MALARTMTLGKRGQGRWRSIGVQQQRIERESLASAGGGIFSHLSL